MGRIVYSALVENIRGSIGGTTFQKNAYGYTVKKKPNIIRPASTLQNNAKARLTRAVKAWRQITATERSNWDSWASANPQYAKHNPSSQLSGYAAFVKYNSLHAFIASGLVTDPYFVVPADDTGVPTVANSAGTLNLLLNSSTADGDWLFLVYLSRLTTDTQNFIGTKTRFMAISANDETSAINITSAYSSVFGSIPSTGSKVAMDFQLIGTSYPIVQAKQSSIITIG
jgi:hypothetical protein